MLLIKWVRRWSKSIRHSSSAGSTLLVHIVGVQLETIYFYIIFPYTRPIFRDELCTCSNELIPQLRMRHGGSVFKALTY